MHSENYSEYPGGYSDNEQSSHRREKTPVSFISSCLVEFLSKT
jgi:hypothetical protein